MKISLRNKLIIMVEGVLIVFALMAGFLSYAILQNVFRDRIYAQLISVTTLKENRIRSFITDISLEIEHLASNSKVNSQLVHFINKKEAVDKEELTVFFTELLDLKGTFSNYFVLDDLGNVVLSSTKTDEGKIKATEPYFLNAKENTFLQDFYYDVALGSPAMMVGTPIKDESGKFVGVLVGRITVGELSKLIQVRSGLGETGESLVVNFNHLVITDLLKEPGMALKKTIFVPQMAECLAGKTFAGRVTDYHGDDVFGYYKWFPEIKSCIVTKQDASEVLAPLYRLYLYASGVILLVLVLVGAMVLVIGRKMFAPLQALQTEVQKINAGNYDVRVDVNSGDELAEVGKAFNEMGEKLRVSYRGLEAKVAEKTQILNEKVADLEKLNKLMVGRELKMMELKKELSTKNDPS